MKVFRGLLFSLAACFALVLAGCGGGGSSSSSVSPSSPGGGGASTSTLSGTVMGGAAPVTGSSVVLWASGQAGGQATAIGKATSDSSGKFSISYTNPKGPYVLYATAYSGNAGSGANNNIQMASVVGMANSVSSSDSVTVNELSTAAFMQAFSSTYTASGIVGATSTQASYAANLVDPSTGTMKATSGNKIESLNLEADILAACNQSNGSSSGPCGTITAASGNAKDMALAMVNWNADSSAVNWGEMYGLVNGTTDVYDDNGHPVSDMTSKSVNPPPASTTIDGGSVANALVKPMGIAIDSACNVWVGSNASTGYITELVPGTGGTIATPLSGFNGSDTFGTPSMMAYTDGELFSTDGNGVGYFQPPSGLVLGGTNGLPNDTLEFGGMAASTGQLAGDVWVDFEDVSGSFGWTAGTSWVVHPGLVSAELSAQVAHPGPVAVDNSDGYVYTGDPVSNTVTQFSVIPGTSNSYGSMTQTAVCNTVSPAAMAVDGNGNVWVASSSGNRLTELPGGACNSSHWDLANGGTIWNSPSAVAIDGANNVWVANKGNDTLVELVMSASAPYFKHYALPQGSQPVSLAIDPMGDVWVADNGTNKVSVFYGAAKGVGSCTVDSSAISSSASPSAATTDFDWSNPSIGAPSSGGSSSGNSAYGSDVYWSVWNFMLGGSDSLSLPMPWQ